MSKLLKEKQWYGEFFIPDQYEKRFSGKLEYSPTNSIMLSYTIPGDDINLLPDSKIVYGILNNGEKCTLIGSFSLRYGNSYNSSSIAGKRSFKWLVIGEFIKEKELFFNIEFSIPNTQDFFDPNISNWEHQALISLPTSYGKLEIWNMMGSNGLFNINIIDSINKEALGELNIAFDNINAKYQDAYFQQKQQYGIEFYLKIDSGALLDDIYENIMEIANLFAILIHNPVYPKKIKMSKELDDGSYLDVQLYPSIVFNERTIELCKPYDIMLPIINSNIDLASVITKWLEISKNHWIASSMIQHRTGFVDNHSLHGEIVLYVTLLESISSNDSILDQKYKKYQYPLEKYGCEEILQPISQIFFKVGITDIGVAISDLRNDIAHIGRPKKILELLTFKDMIRISNYMELTILGYILHELGIANDVIEKYQKLLIGKII